MGSPGQSIEARLSSALADRYRVESEIGKGGMATVFLAHDSRHDRKVAVKVLNPELSAVVGSERFLTEIQTTAHLQHPHILPLYDSGEADGVLFYVMPYVEGESLRARIDREKQLPIDLAVTITRQVAAALGYAHEEGIIHRDIKPANILIHKGEALVADFGIALAVTAAGGARLTDTGLSLGTPEYMSPEQAAGDRALDAKSDIYSLGCVAYEMLAGEPPHTGPTTQAIIAKIITDEPQSLGARRRSVPRNVDAAVGRALEKLPADRFKTAEAFASALTDVHFRHGAAAVGAGRTDGGLWNWLSVTLAAVALLAALGLGWSLMRTPALPVVRSTLTFTEAQGVWSGAIGVNLALCPDGSMFVYRGASQLWQRRLHEMDPEPIPGTEGAINPVISPDGSSLAFVVQGSRSLKTVSLAGAPPFTVVPSGVWDGPGGGIDWGSDGMLYFTDDNGAIQRVAATGGEVLPVTANEPGTRHAWVDALPDGEGLLFSVTRGLPEQSEIAVIGFDDGEVHGLIRGAMARYARSGHLVFASADGTLLTAPFDVDQHEVTGPTVQLSESVDVYPGSESQFAVSETGALLYVPGGGAYELVPVWADRSGATQEIHPGWLVQGDPVWTSVVLSPDGNRLAISKRDSEGRFDLWVKQLDTGPESRLTFEGTLNYRPVWSADGQALTFISNRSGERDIWSKRADGSSTAELVLDRDQQIFEVLYSPESDWLVFREGGYSAGDILGIELGADSNATPLVTTEYQEREIALSPDGRWLAYVSNWSGSDEVYVRPFPNADAARWQVSNDGGTEPVWGRNGRELFYRNGSSELVAVQVMGDPSFAVGQQRVLFSVAGYMFGNGRPQYDVSADDQRFVLLRIGSGVATDPILVQNYYEELKAKTEG